MVFPPFSCIDALLVTMSKRPHSELHHPAETGKRQRSKGPIDSSFSEALGSVAKNSGVLINCLKSLEQWYENHGDGDGAASFPQAAQLSSLSQKLGPAFGVLGSTLQGSNVESNTASREEDKNGRLAQCVPIPHSLVEPWSSSDIPDELPPLPQIKNPDLERQTFSHPGVAARDNYERLEWLGDAYLELIATAIIHATFPTMPSGRCSQIREQLVRNVTLARFFREYKMEEKARLPPEIGQFATQRPGRGRSSDKDLLKTQGDMFEAYVASIIVGDAENGLSDCIRWLRALWSMVIKDQIIRAERDSQPPAAGDAAAPGAKTPSPKEQLATLIVVKGIELRYKDIPGKDKKDRHLGLPLFTVGVYLTGWGEDNKLLGWGTALNKKEAGQKAATRALENKKQMKIYCQKKQASMEASGAAREAEEAAAGAAVERDS